MIRGPEDVMKLVDTLSVSTWTLTALGALFESRLVDQLAQARTLDELTAACPSLSHGQIERCLEVAIAEELVVEEGSKHRLADGVRPLLEPPLRTALPALMRATLMQALAFLDTSSGEKRITGWSHEDQRLLCSQGEASSMLAMMMKRRIVPALDGLAERLERPDGRFLDVGVGVGALAISMCRLFPHLRVVGVDVFDRALAIAREDVAAAGLGERIELRHSAVEQLEDEAAFDLAWLPSFFIPTAAASLPRLSKALRPGGWLLCAMTGSGGTPRETAANALVNELWGGATFGAPEAEALLHDAGFTSVRTLPNSDPSIAFVVARRPL